MKLLNDSKYIIFKEGLSIELIIWEKSSVSEKSLVEINHTKKTLQSRFIWGRRKICDGGGVLGKGVEAGAGETVSQELGFRYGKLTLAQAYRQAVGAAQLQDVSEMLNMRR